jgi:hypothetical protein
MRTKELIQVASTRRTMAPVVKTISASKEILVACQPILVQANEALPKQPPPCIVHPSAMIANDQYPQNQELRFHSTNIRKVLESGSEATYRPVQSSISSVCITIRYVMKRLF